MTETMTARGAGQGCDWQPIESAPKQRVVLLWALTDTDTGNWKMATGHWCPGYRDEPGQWEWDGRRLKPHDVQPTHWQPLPEPPAAAPSSMADGGRTG